MIGLLWHLPNYSKNSKSTSRGYLGVLEPPVSGVEYCYQDGVVCRKQHRVALRRFLDAISSTESEYFSDVVSDLDTTHSSLVYDSD